jgi:uncharacterized heparinase superfamily protein
MSFLGATRDLSDASGWNDSGCSKLWLYNAHYFDDLVANRAFLRHAWHTKLIGRWIKENPPGLGNGWEPYPASLRIVNWIKWSLAGNELGDEGCASLATQVRWLEKRLEFHLLGNHLWANAKALVFAGVWFGGQEGGRWLQRGLRLMQSEIEEQILGDGAHFERSPMYHSVLLEDLLDLVQLGRMGAPLPCNACNRWLQAAESMLQWAESMAHPDGDPAFFNDAARGIAPNLTALKTYASKLGLTASVPPVDGIHSFASSGFVRMQRGSAVLIADVGSIAPDYIPGHAHAGTLSFELSLDGRRVLVNSGTSTYEQGDLRTWQRGTAAHNTVVVDGANSSEVWASFRVARRARVSNVRIDDASDILSLSAQHDGYRRLPGRVLHTRAWQLGAGWLDVSDRLDGDFRLAEARYHFAPGTKIKWEVLEGDSRIEASKWHPEFGIEQQSSVLIVRFRGAQCRVRFYWS